MRNNYSSAFKKICESRRSVRIFESNKVPTEVIRESLSLSLLAPNSSNLQPWEFYWIQSKNLKKELIPIFLSQTAIKTAPELIIAVARTNTWKKNNNEIIKIIEHRKDTPNQLLHFHRKDVPFIYDIGLFGIKGYIKKTIVFLLGFFRAVLREPFTSKNMKLWAVKSTALACQNFMLSISSFGYDSCPLEGFDTKKLKKKLKLQADATIVMGIAVGKKSSSYSLHDRVRLDERNFLKKV